MKDKANKAKVLTKDLVKYSMQIGLTPIPRLVFTPKEFDTISRRLECGHRRTKRHSCLGKCNFSSNVILVNLEYQGTGYRNTYNRLRQKTGWVPRKMGLKSAQHTLVHELVHMRWKKMWHGYHFDKRIDEIMAGKTFDPIEIK